MANNVKFDDQMPYMGASITYERFINDNLGISETNIELSVEELKRVILDMDMHISDDVDCDQKIYSWLMAMKPAEIRDIFKECASLKGLPLENNAVKELGGVKNRKNIIDLFSLIFKVLPQNGTLQTPEQPKLEPEPHKIIVEPIQNFVLSLDDFGAIYERCDEVPIDDRIKDVRDSFDWYENQTVNVKDNLFLKIKDGVIDTRFVAVLNDQDVVALGETCDHNGKLFLLFEKLDNIKNKGFDPSISEYKLAFFPFGKLIDEKYNGDIYTVKCRIIYKPMPEADRPLCIDFGTSNTTVGTYDKNIAEYKEELIRFQDVTQKTPEFKEILPTVVYVLSCKDCISYNDVKYCFGYEAQKKIIEYDYAPKASVFYEIKRWMNSLDEMEELEDEQQNRYEVPRYAIVKAYLQYVVDAAEQQCKEKFTKLHFTSPVRSKESFINSFKMMFGSEREIIPAYSSLDEGTAVIYHRISETIKDNPGLKEKSGNLVIIDCGGGTTDLAECNYSIIDEHTSYKMDITTKFENGEANFGGNNITYRILQLLKIKITQALLNEDIYSAQEIIHYNELDILNMIDADSYNDIYKKLESVYASMEYYIPTQYAKAEGKMEKARMKRNYFYLWKLAEAIKIEFFTSELASVNFSYEKDREIVVGENENTFLYVRMNKDSDDFQKVEGCLKNISITAFEIKRLIYADLYNLLSNLLEHKSIANNNDTNFYLSGQSCKINIFHDLLKEFIPGKNLRSKQQDNSNALKMNCIKGSIKYMFEQANGIVAVQMNEAAPELIYSVEINGKKALYRNGSNIEYHIIGLPITARVQSIEVFDSNHLLKNSIVYKMKEGDEFKLSNLGNDEKVINIGNILRQEISFEEDEIEKVLQKLNNLAPGIHGSGSEYIVLFALPAKDGFGFRIYRMYINNYGKYLVEGGSHYVSFESPELMTFFNGER